MDAVDFVTEALAPRPELVVHKGNLPTTALALRDVLAAANSLYDRGIPVRLVQPADGGAPAALPLTVNSIVVEAHRLCQVVRINEKREHVPMTLPDRVARMYLDMGEWNLPALAGITTAPLLDDAGQIIVPQGYDRATGLWCANVPMFDVPDQPTRDAARVALLLLRQTFKTFPFADSPRHWDSGIAGDVVDVDKPPGRDESAFLAGVLSAVCRASLRLCPGLMLGAPKISGAGSGKGLLVRCICAIAFGVQPRAFTAGHDRQELDKRFAAEFMESGPAVFLDNVNAATLRSETLASVMTERPSRVRMLGVSKMVLLNSTAMIFVTGNGLTIGEDLARRFIVCELDAKCEDPEARDFRPDFLDEIRHRRAELLTAALTIWRWGRQNTSTLGRGRSLGGFETWCAWVRDPLMALGCRDPVERLSEIKGRDPHRGRVAELFQVWWECHQAAAVKIADLAESVVKVVDPQGRGRQFLQAEISKHDGTRVAGFVLTRQEAAGKWGAATYQLCKSEGSEGVGHRDHRDHGEHDAPMPPMSPMPGDLEAADVPAGGERIL